MSEIFDEGLTIENQESPDLNEGVTEPAAAEESDQSEAVAEIPAETPPPKPTTKRVSDRINQIRAESDAKVLDLKEQLELANGKLLAYRAKEQGITVEELAIREKMEEDNFKNALHNDPEFLELQKRDFERQKMDVLTQLQTAFPKDGIDSLDNLPQDFFRMLQVGTDPVIAYRASVADAQKETPPSTGSIKSQGEVAKGSISEEQALSMDTNEWIKWLDENET